MWTSSMLSTIRGFYHRAYQWLIDKKPRRQQNGTYKYCPVDEATEVCILRPIQVYISQRRQHILTYILKTKIYNLCREVVRTPGTPIRTQF